LRQPNDGHLYTFVTVTLGAPAPGRITDGIANDFGIAASVRQCLPVGRFGLLGSVSSRTIIATRQEQYSDTDFNHPIQRTTPTFLYLITASGRPMMRAMGLSWSSAFPINGGETQYSPFGSVARNAAENRPTTK
jgi:hypothetical protein